MNTVKLEGKKPQMIAHRGVSGLETENTLPAFLAAANRSYFGIETDVHKTADGEFVLMHDGNTKRVSDAELQISESSLEQLRNINIYSIYEPRVRADLKIPLLKDYASICARYEKKAVLELKDDFSDEDIASIIGILKDCGALDITVFISFNYDNLVKVREQYPKADIQFLSGEWNDGLIAKLKKYDFDLDIEHGWVNKERIKLCHDNGIKVNCWTVNSISDAERVIECGVDFITSNILE